jgi:5-hydroxyisourate hydrolase-like protein (transthyretin family)
LYSNSIKQRANNKKTPFDNYGIGQFSIIGTLVMIIFLLTVPLSVPLGIGMQLTNVRAAVDMDVSGDGRAAASDGEESIATDGDSFCSITDDIAGGKFSSLFEGIVGECDNSQISNQFLVEYSYTKNPVKLGEKSYLTVTVKDKNSGSPISDAFVTLGIKPPSSSSSLFETSTVGTAVAAAGISSNQEVVQDKTTQVMHTDNNGRATFTVEVGPKSDLGMYDTELEVTKDSYQSSFEQIDFHVV